MLRSDLAALYSVPVRALVEVVRRIPMPPRGFPLCACFGRVQILEVTEAGLAMRSGVLRSARAVPVDIAIMRTLVQLRALPATLADLRREIE